MDPLVNLLGIAIVAFAVPFLLGFFPKVRIPAVVLEVTAGIVIGPAVLGWVHIDEPVQLMATIGVAFLLFLAGMELDLDVLKGQPLKLGGVSFVASILIGLAIMVPLGAADIILSPLLVTIALAATSVGIVIPVLRDTGQIATPAGVYTVAGASVAEFGTIALLAVAFSTTAPPAVEAVLLVVIGGLAFGLLALLARLSRSARFSVIAMRLDNSSSQVRVRLAVVLLLGAAVIADTFGFEMILGTFLAGAILAVVVKSWPDEEGYRRKLEAVGFGFFVPMFFVSSGMKLDISGLNSPAELMRIVIFFFALLLIRGLPALAYRKHLSSRATKAAGLLQATNLSFIVVATGLGVESGEMRPITASSLVIAGLLSALVFPAIAQKLLASELPVADPSPSRETIDRERSDEAL